MMVVLQLMFILTATTATAGLENVQPPQLLDLASGRPLGACERNCDHCSSPTMCTRCTNNWYLDHDGHCHSSCPLGYYESGSGLTGRTCQVVDGRRLTAASVLTIPPDFYTDDCVSIGQPTNSADITAIAWVRTTATSGAILARWKDVAGKKVWLLMIYDGRLHVYVSSDGNGEPEVQGPTSINDGSWHMVGMVHNSATGSTSVYLDGSVDSTSTTVGALNGGSDEGILLGGHNDQATDECGSWVLSGDIGNVVVYAVALTDSEMSAVAAGTLPDYSKVGSWPQTTTTTTTETTKTSSTSTTTSKSTSTSTTMTTSTSSTTTSKPTSSSTTMSTSTSNTDDDDVFLSAAVAPDLYWLAVSVVALHVTADA